MRRRDPGKPFFDIDGESSCFSIPQRKWRELVFIGAMIRDGEDFVRDPSRPLPFFRVPDLFPVGARFQVEEDGKRATVRRIG